MDNQKSYSKAYYFAILTIVFTFIEAGISIYFGYSDENFTLLGFGIDSIIELASAFGVAHMIGRIQKDADGKNRNNFEKNALQITGYGLILLAIGLVISSLYNIYSQHKPEATLSGIIISIGSITAMYFLMVNKKKLGKKLSNRAILADAECTKVCIYMSVIVLASSVIYHFTNFIYIDAIGCLGLAYFSYKEGKEALENAENDTHCSC